jgi:hypothetical protein
MKALITLTLTLLLLATAAPARGQVVANRAVLGFYQQYLGRTPHWTEVRGWAMRVEAGEITLTDVRVSILASQEYFDRHRNSSPRFIRGLYRDILGRRASPDEVEGWLRVYRRVRGNRDQLVRRFLGAAQPELEMRRNRDYPWAEPPVWYRQDGARRRQIRW